MVKKKTTTKKVEPETTSLKLSFPNLLFLGEIGLDEGTDYWLLTKDGSGRHTVFFNNIGPELAQELVEIHGGTAPNSIIVNL